jgi:hypothetical protein
MAEPSFDKTMDDLPFNAVFISKQGFIGVKVGRGIDWGYDEDAFVVRHLITHDIRTARHDADVCEVKLDHALGPYSINVSAGVVLGQLMQAGLIEREAAS